MICSKVLIHKETKNYWTDQIVNLTVSDDGVTEMLLDTPEQIEISLDYS